MESQVADIAGLLASAQAGDESAWSALYRRYAGPLRGYLTSRGAREPDDLLAEVFVDLARRIHAFSGTEAQFRSWIFMVAHNRVIDERRRMGRRPADPTLPEDLERPATTTVEDDAVGRLMAADALALIDALTPDQRDVLRLRLVDGFTTEEVAERLGKPISAVKALQRRGLATVARRRAGGGAVSK